MLVKENVKLKDRALEPLCIDMDKGLYAIDILIKYYTIYIEYGNIEVIQH